MGQVWLISLFSVLTTPKSSATLLREVKRWTIMTNPMKAPDEWAREADWSGFSKKLEGFVPDGVVRKAVGAPRGGSNRGGVVRFSARFPERSWTTPVSRSTRGKGSGRPDGTRTQEFLEETDVSGEVRKILTGISWRSQPRSVLSNRMMAPFRWNHRKTKAKRKPRTTPKKKKATRPSSPLSPPEPPDCSGGSALPLKKRGRSRVLQRPSTKRRSISCLPR